MEGIDKMFAELDGVPVLARTLMALQECDGIDEIVLVVREGERPLAAKICAQYGITKTEKIVNGGSTRAESVWNGMQAVSDEAAFVAVHDGARPFVTPELVKRVITAAKVYSAAAPGVQVKDTIKVVKNGRVVDTPKRETLYAIQTPQIFDADLLMGALSNAMERKLAITDECMAVEAIGGSVQIVPGSYENIKITTPGDMAIGQAILNGRKDSK